MPSPENMKELENHVTNFAFSLGVPTLIIIGIIIAVLGLVYLAIHAAQSN